ncbi:unnamed protein product, partial [Sphenostylis stenocarpa]
TMSEKAKRMDMKHWRFDGAKFAGTTGLFTMKMYEVRSYNDKNSNKNMVGSNSQLLDWVYEFKRLNLATLVTIGLHASRRFCKRVRTQMALRNEDQ